jgi:hypothetical protein
MDTSVDGVTLYSGFLSDILGEYETMRESCGPLFDLVTGMELGDPAKPVPIATYNALCDWVEANLGTASLRRAGNCTNPTPSAVMHALKWAADTMIQDPKGRGWAIVVDEPRRIVMRRTQTFHCLLQEGLLTGMLGHCPVLSPRVEHVKCVRRGDEFCEYSLTWVDKRR